MEVYNSLLIIFINVQVSKMKAEYIPPREDMIVQNEAPDDVYIIVSGEVEIIDCRDKDKVLGILQPGDMFGEIDALCGRPHSFTCRTKTLAELLRLKTNDLREATQARREDNVQVLKNLLQVRMLWLVVVLFIV